MDCRKEKNNTENGARKKAPRFLTALILMAAIVAADQLVKYAVRQNLRVGDSISVAGSFFRITHVFNTGAAFGILAGKTPVLMLFPVIVIAGLLIFVLRQDSLQASCWLGVTMAAAGGIGNLIDRTIKEDQERAGNHE